MLACSIYSILKDSALWLPLERSIPVPATLAHFIAARLSCLVISQGTCLADAGERLFALAALADRCSYGRVNSNGAAALHLNMLADLQLSVQQVAAAECLGLHWSYT